MGFYYIGDGIYSGKKCKFLENNLAFFGQISVEKGHGLIKMCKIFDKYTNPFKPCRSSCLLGIGNYRIKYTHHFASLTAPLRELTKKNAIFELKEGHLKETFIICYARSVAVSGILCPKISRQ